MAFKDENGTPWVSKARLEEGIQKHAAQHNGEVAYLREVASVYPLAVNNQEGRFDLLGMDKKGNETSRAATLAIDQRGREEGKRGYGITLEKKGSSPRSMAIVLVNGVWAVYHYARQD